MKRKVESSDVEKICNSDINSHLHEETVEVLFH